MSLPVRYPDAVWDPRVPAERPVVELWPGKELRFDSIGMTVSEDSHYTWLYTRFAVLRKEQVNVELSYANWLAKAKEWWHWVHRGALSWTFEDSSGGSYDEHVVDFYSVRYRDSIEGISEASVSPGDSRPYWLDVTFYNADRGVADARFTVRVQPFIPQVPRVVPHDTRHIHQLILPYKEIDWGADPW